MLLRVEYSVFTLCLILLSGLFSGCASKPPTKFYSLRAQSNPAVEIELPAQLRLGIGPVRLPSELDRPGIVSEQNGSGIKIAGYQVWAGELEDMTSTALAGLMAEHAGLEQVYSAPWDTRFRPEYQLRVDVERFSGELGGQVALDAVWTLSGNAGKSLLHTRRSTLREDTGDRSYLAYVNAMNSLLSKLSVLVARELENVVAGSVTRPLPATAKP